MKNKIIKLFYGILLLDCVTAQRISKLKCYEYEEASILTDSLSMHPHLMEIIKLYADRKIMFGFGSLISEAYVLTSVSNNFRIGDSMNQFRVSKAKLIGERYRANKYFSIHRLFTFSESVFRNSDVALIQLNETISYRYGMSIFRPACLWTKTVLPTSSYTTYGLWNSSETEMNDYLSSILVIRGNILDEEKCTEILRKKIQTNVDGLTLCLNSTRRESHTFSSPIHAKIKDRNYVIGTVFNDPALSSLATKLSSYIPWIESTVWPEHTVEVTRDGCGQRKIKYKPLVTHGFPTYHGEYPWHVALHRLDAGRRKCLNYICGGTIISSRVVVTAAHCVQNEYGVLPANRLIIVAGIHDLNQYTVDTQNYLVQRIVVHNGYNREYIENDIALIKLNHRIEFSNYIQPICFGNISHYSNMTFGVVVGWGLTELNQQSNMLLQATLPVRTNVECRQRNRPFFHTFLNDNNFCAGLENGTNVCSGDSGGAMIFEYKSRFYIRGIVSLGVPLPNSSYCDVTQMILLTDVPKFFDWILTNLKSESKRRKLNKIF